MVSPVTPNVAMVDIPVALKSLVVNDSVYVPFLALNSSKKISSLTYKSPPTYKSVLVVTIPVIFN